MTQPVTDPARPEVSGLPVDRAAVRQAAGSDGRFRCRRRSMLRRPIGRVPRQRLIGAGSDVDVTLCRATGDFFRTWRMPGARFDAGTGAGDEGGRSTSANGPGPTPPTSATSEEPQ